jgi:hypothetical protein
MVQERPPYYYTPQYRSHRASRVGCGILAVAVIGLGVIGGVVLYNAVNPEKDITATVTDKVVKNDGKSSTYLIFTDKGVLQDSDSMIKGKWNSSDIYSELKTGKTYTFHIRGIRNHVLSWYPNIITVKPVK